MTINLVNSGSLLGRRDSIPTSLFASRPAEPVDGDRLEQLPQAMSWDAEIDRWVNEGGAIRQRAESSQRSKKLSELPSTSSFR
jgi:hypothetical protein